MSIDAGSIGSLSQGTRQHPDDFSTDEVATPLPLHLHRASGRLPISCWMFRTIATKGRIRSVTTPCAIPATWASLVATVTCVCRIVLRWRGPWFCRIRETANGPRLESIRSRRQLSRPARLGPLDCSSPVPQIRNPPPQSPQSQPLEEVPIRIR